MRTTLIALIAVATVAGGARAQQQLPEPVPPSLSELREIRSTYIIQFNDTVTGEQAPGLARGMAARFNGQVRHVYTASIVGAAIKLSEQGVARLLAAGDLDVVRIERDQVAMAYGPPAGAGPGNGKNGGSSSSPANGCTQKVSWGTARVLAAIVDNGTDLAGSCETNNQLGFLGDYDAVTGPASIGDTAPLSVCVLDTGVDLDHPDLNVSPGPHFSAFTNRRDAGPDDLNGHGTHVAGTIGAISNEIGALGVAPGAMITSVKVLDRRGSGSYSGVIAGVDWAAENGCDVANMSLGGPFSATLNAAVELAADKGVYFALAAGNESADANTKSPASAEHPRIRTVAAATASDGWASFSNFGQPPIDVILPGASIFSTYKDGGYATGSGTSMAAPHMAGLLLRELAAGGTILEDGAEITGSDADTYRMPIDPRTDDTAFPVQPGA